ncbi:hypothetical protein O6H91_09G113700 [Diphasiastrum complanatum]|uniref:Uncharacterized protein n=1 Tax=Diphasiastrum complanatum TaxID=34168 RepID=A0ACC2CTB4_DIPCM|nr:hypothetical protein O6H91_09G113700 [Diphasiastrum complanatum]
MDPDNELLCAEEVVGSPWSHERAESNDNSAPEQSVHYHGCFTDFPVQDEAAITYLFEKESSFMPDAHYVSSIKCIEICSARCSAVQWMLKVHRFYNFRSITISIAVNYLDRYLAKHLAKSWKAWMIQLLSVACLSIAAKMEEEDVPLLQEMQIEGLEHIFESKTIQRMELAILISLDWRMSCVTAYAYIDFFFYKLNLSRHLQRSLLIRVTELLMGTLSEAEFIEFRPSTLALSATGCALEEAVPLQAEMHKCTLYRIFPSKGSLEECERLMEELVVDPLCPLNSFSQTSRDKSSASNAMATDHISQAGDGPQSVSNRETVIGLRPADTGQTVLLSLSSLKKRKRKASEHFK